MSLDSASTGVRQLCWKLQQACLTELEGGAVIEGDMPHRELTALKGASAKGETKVMKVKEKQRVKPPCDMNKTSLLSGVRGA